MSMSKNEVYNRLNDFIEFHNESCLADTIVLPLKEYLRLIGADDKTKENAILFYSLTYSVPSTIILLEKYNEFISNPNKFHLENKDKLVFQSDRKYVKMNNSFVKAFFEMKKSKVFNNLYGQKIINFDNAVKQIENCYFFGRFSAFLFLETYCCIFDKTCSNNKIDWKNGSTVTSGLLNVLYRDKEANLWDKERKLYINPQWLDCFALSLLDKVSNGKEIAVLETNLCAYRKLFKGSRYLGYYSDRVLEEIYIILKNYPEHKNSINLLFKARENIIPACYLGEKNNWNGIRKELKKYYLKNGSWKWQK